MSGNVRIVDGESTALRGPPPGPVGTMGTMLTLIRRVAAALGLAGLIATLFRLRGKGGVPPTTGGWREVPQSELRR